MMSDLKSLVAKARAEAVALEQEQPTPVPVLLGGELVDVGVRPVLGRVWDDLTATNPPRPGSVQDENLGFNVSGVVRDYPVSHLLVAGEPVKAERVDDDDDEPTWGEIFDLLPSPSRKLLAAMLWGINQNEPQKKIAELGKARASAPKRKRPLRVN